LTFSFRSAVWETVAKAIDLIAHPLQKLPGYELIFTSSASHLRKFINVDTRGKMRTALENPSILASSSSVVPDTALVFQLMSSCPTRYIGLPDIMEAFVQETTDDAAYSQARFSRAVSELQLMGFLKSTARRTDAAERSFFAPPGAAAFST
jgi:origin recognition complex subunit 3